MAKTPEEILEEARKLIGAETELVPDRYPIEYDPIRRFCHMSDDTNPLFLDLDYAKQTKYGEVLCPPMMITMPGFGGNGAWPPPTRPQPRLPSIPTAGERAINLTTEYEFYKPVRVGDRLFRKQRIADVYIKPIRLDPKAFWILTEQLIYNQDGELVAKASNLLLRHRTPEEVAAAGDRM